MAELLIPTDPVNAPFADALPAALAGTGDMFTLVTHDEADWRLRENECDAALVSPFTYAGNEGELAIVPGVAVSAVGPTGDALLCFNGGLTSLTSVAVPAGKSVDIVLAHIILRERFGMHPEFSVYSGSPSEALAYYDAVLVTGADAIERAGNLAYIDLVDEWFDMQQLPLVRGLVAGWTHRLSPGLAEGAARAAAEADHQVLLGLQSMQDGRLSPDEIHFIPGHYRYQFDDDAAEGLQAFFRLAFFLGLHRDIPTFNIWTPETAD